MLLVSWNVAGRVERLPAQAEAILAVEPDVICLQEVTRRTLPLWSAQLADAGYLGLEHGAVPTSSPARRPLAVLTASRSQLQRLPVGGLPWPERVVAVRSASGAELVNVHAPTSQKPDLAKVLTLEAVHSHVTAAPAGSPRIICGDLNTPRREHADGSIWTFARDRYGRLRADRGERWDRAEGLLLLDLARYGFRDAFRLVHGSDRRELSWEWHRWGGGYRLDHVIVSPEVGVEHCEYEHEWRKVGLSDHSPLVARLTA